MATTSHTWVGKESAGGRYRVTALLGEGGMGCVYRARDANLDCDGVIKVPRPGLLDDPEFAGQAIADCTEALRLDPNLGLAYSNRAYACNNRKDSDQAIEDASQAVRLDPKLATGYFQRGYAHNTQGLYDRRLRPQRPLRPQFITGQGPSPSPSRRGITSNPSTDPRRRPATSGVPRPARPARHTGAALPGAGCVPLSSRPPP
jgi:hypothetical protein